MPYIINLLECAVCGACEAECPVGAISIHESNRYYVVDVVSCTDCGECAEVCPTSAIAPTNSSGAEKNAP